MRRAVELLQVQLSAANELYRGEEEVADFGGFPTWRYLTGPCIGHGLKPALRASAGAAAGG